MPYRNLKLRGAWRTDRFNDGSGRTRLFGKFGEDQPDSPELEWTPRWDDVAALLVEAVEVERLNMPGSKYLEQFAEVARRIVTKYASMNDVSRIEARITSIEKTESGLRVSYDSWSGTRWWMSAGQALLAVPLSEDSVRNLMAAKGGQAAIVVWNGDIIDLKPAERPRDD